MQRTGACRRARTPTAQGVYFGRASVGSVALEIVGNHARIARTSPHVDIVGRQLYEFASHKMRLYAKTKSTLCVNTAYSHIYRS